MTRFFEDGMCLHEPQRRYMSSYWDADYRTDGLRDAEGRLKLTTLAELYEKLERSNESFDGPFIGRLRRDLRAKLSILRGQRIDRDIFDLFIPPAPDASSASIGDLTAWSYDRMLDALTDDELDDLGVGSADAFREELRHAAYRSIETLTMILIGSWFGETKPVVTEVPTVDAWMAEAQEGVTEFSIPKRHSEELIRRQRYRNQTLNRETGTVRDPRGALARMVDEPLDRAYTLDDFERMYELAMESNGW